MGAEAEKFQPPYLQFPQRSYGQDLGEEVRSLRHIYKIIFCSQFGPGDSCEKQMKLMIPEGHKLQGQKDHQRRRLKMMNIILVFQSDHSMVTYTKPRDQTDNHLMLIFSLLRERIIAEFGVCFEVGNMVCKVKYPRV